jgi:hypothetical protein
MKKRANKKDDDNSANMRSTRAFRGEDEELVRAICRTENNRHLTDWTTRAIARQAKNEHEMENPTHATDFEEQQNER